MAPQIDTEQVLGWLRMVCPPRTPGRLWIGSASSRFAGRRFDPTDLPSAVAEVVARDRDPGVFLRMGTIRHDAAATGRGTALETATTFGFWVDLDIKGPGHKHDPAKYDGLELPPDEDVAASFVDGLPEPTAWHRSGGGMYAYWLPPDGPYDTSTPEYQARWSDISTRLQWAVHHRALDLGYYFGTGTGDLARILRIPGTVNRKVAGQPRMCEVISGWGPRWTIEQMDAAIPPMPTTTQAPTVRVMGIALPPVASRVPGAAAIPTVPAAAVQRASSRLVAPKRPFEDPPGAVGPLDDYVNSNDLRALLVADGWSFSHSVQGRDHYARPGKSKKDGASGNVWTGPDGRQVLYVFSDDTGLPTMRGLSAAQWYAYRFHGGDTRAAASELRRAGYGTPAEQEPTSVRQAAQEIAQMASSMASAAPSANSDTPGGTDAPPVPTAPVPVVAEGTTDAAATGQDELGMWGERDILRAVFYEAWHARIAPWGALGAVLADASSRIGPHVVLPARGGAKGSLNLLVMLVGEPGRGKGVAMSLAKVILGPTQVTKHEMGTGQGIDAAYTAMTKEGPAQYNDTVLWEIPEVDSLTASSRMVGSNLMPTLRKLYSGEALGAFYADRNKRRPVAAHRYRAGVVIGVQPKRAQPILDDAAGGTPQRFLWLRVQRDKADPVLPWLPARPGLQRPIKPHLWQDYLAWMPQYEQPDGQAIAPRDWVIMTHSDASWEAVRAEQERIYAGHDDSDELAGHSMQTRLKVAAVLALIDGRTHLTDEDWEIACWVWARSERTTRQIRQSLSTHRLAEVEQQALKAAQTQVLTEELTNRRGADAAHKRIMTVLGKLGPDQWMSGRDLARAQTMAGRSHHHEALQALVEDGKVATQMTTGGNQARQEYRLAH